MGAKIIYKGEMYIVWGRSLTHGYLILYKDGKLIKMI